MKAKTVVLSLAAAFCLLTTGGTWAKVIYVDDDAPTGGDGASWTTAYRFLQDTLGKAEAWDEIRVAQGIYKPDRSSAHPDGTGDRNASFCLLDGVAIRGGFAGTGAIDPNARDIVLYETILSGDLAEDDTPVIDPCDLLTEPTRSENSYTVVTAGACSRSTVLDGVTISSGNAMGAERYDLDPKGAGLLLSYYGVDCCPSITNCILYGNHAYYGGGAYVVGAAPEFVNCSFLNNAAVYGGAILTSAWRDQWFISTCEFMIGECLFAGNHASGSGGAIQIGPGGPSRIEGSTFTRNSGGIGGAIYSDLGGNIANCLFTHNAAKDGGGAVYFAGTATLNIASCTFFGNAAHVGSGLASLEALHEGGTPPSAIITNTILWDGGDEIGAAEDASVEVAYSDVQGGWPGVENIDVDPLFASPAYWNPNGTADDPNDDFFVEGDYHLKSQAGRWDSASGSWVQDEVTSPCIDAGDPNTPIGDEPFPNGGRINMGAYGGTTEASKSYFGEPVTETIIAGDINGDGKVDWLDLDILASHWFQMGE